MAVHNAQLHASVSELNKDIRIAFVVGEFNEEITETLYTKNKDFLTGMGFTHIDRFSVPGAFEIPAMCKKIAQREIYNLIITLGCVIEGETPHFHYVCDACTQGVKDVSIESETPIIFGVLTCSTLKQAQARVNDNYAVYGLNYLSERDIADQRLDERYNELIEQAGEILESLDT